MLRRDSRTIDLIRGASRFYYTKRFFLQASLISRDLCIGLATRGPSLAGSHSDVTGFDIKSHSSAVSSQDDYFPFDTPGRERTGILGSTSQLAR